ncbi:3-methyl-2-oxobutanoate hydroxymethyltransferase, partial [Fusobacterium polymorphum]
NIDVAIKNAGRFIVEADVDAVKLEGGLEIIPIIKALVDVGIPVIGHTGFSLQSREIGLGKTNEEKAKDFFKICREMEKAGVIAIVYTEVPLEVAKQNYEEAT